MPCNVAQYVVISVCKNYNWTVCINGGRLKLNISTNNLTLDLNNNCDGCL